MKIYPYLVTNDSVTKDVVIDDSVINHAVINDSDINDCLTKDSFKQERIQFTVLRRFMIEKGRLKDFKAEIKKYTKDFDLGTIIWPSYEVLFTENLEEMVDYIKEKNLVLFDIWGYVPGSGPGGYWVQYKPDLNRLKHIEAVLGENWKGVDVGEQDGRYVMAYVFQMLYPNANKVEHFLNFDRHIGKMCDELGGKMVSLTSITLGHHELKYGHFTGIGAETGQMHPNSQVFYAFLRGAGKQYQVPWFGNVSIYNRFGFKIYLDGEPDKDQIDHFPHSDTKGTSLNLLKRLLYSHIFYNCSIVGFESMWFRQRVINGCIEETDVLSPVGRIQQAAVQWVRQNAPVGTLLTPVAVLCDFFGGWTFPNYNYQIYRRWGNLPFTAGDYFADHVFDLFYPQYQDSSYFYDETGFNSATPYGDIVDALLSDVKTDLLFRYDTLILATETDMNEEFKDKLEAYVRQGGTLVMTAGNLAKCKGWFLGAATGALSCFEAGTVTTKAGIVTEPYTFSLYSLSLPSGAEILAQEDASTQVAAATFSYGQGSVLLFASPFAVTNEPVLTVLSFELNKALEKPHPLLAHVRLLLDDLFKQKALFTVGEGLSIISCRKENGKYTLCVCNNTLEEKEINLRSHIGELISVTELETDQSEKYDKGYFADEYMEEHPDFYENFYGKLLTFDKKTGKILAGDVRIFAVEIEESLVESLPVPTAFKKRPGLGYNIRKVLSIKEEIQRYPTFLDYFDTINLDYQLVNCLEPQHLAQEGKWLQNQGLRVMTDLSSGINLYPNLRLVNNDEKEYTESMAVIQNVIIKMKFLNSRDLILCLHKHPENNFTDEQTVASFIETIQCICGLAEAEGITVYLRTKHVEHRWKTGQKWGSSILLAAAIEKIMDLGIQNLKLAVNTALLHTATLEEVQALSDKIGIWLLASTEFDLTGRLWSANSPLVTSNSLGSLKPYLDLAPQAVKILDCPYENWDEVYRDIKAFESLYND